MCVCGEIGYAEITSGRHSATASATAREPSICLSTGRLRRCAAHEVVGGVAAATLPSATAPEKRPGSPRRPTRA